MRKRSEIEIMVRVLEVSKKGVIKTQLVYGSNLNFNVAERYISKLFKLGLIEILTDERGKKIYKTTEKGIEFIENYKFFFENKLKKQ